MAERKYPELNPWELEPDYSQHVATMTEEGLGSKGAIAEQLAWRDRKLAAALAKVAELEAELESVRRLASRVATSRNELKG